ncbi:MAG: S-layer homology domain-containing protein [Cyanobacteria bacterium P01_D01_bin.71]
MVNLPPPESNDRPPSGPLRDNDEAIAVAIAFLSIGAILWWGWTRGERLFAPVANLPQLSEPATGEANPPIDLDDSDEDSSRPLPERGFSFFGGGADRDANSLDADADADAADSGTSSRSQTTTDSLQRDRVPDTATDFNQGTVSPSQILTDGAIAPDEAVAPTEMAPSDDSAGGAPTADEADAPAPEPLPALDISDVPADYWAYPYIVSLFEKGLLPDLPSGQLQPDKSLTRAEFAALLNSSFVGAEPSRRQLAFSDVPEDFWASNAIKQVVDAGYMTGFPEGTFRPGDLVPRYQVFVTMTTGLNLSPPNDVDAAISRFQGTQDLPAWSRSQVAASASQGLIVNHPDPQQLEPQEPATRAEIIAIIHQALVAQGRVEPVETPFAVPAE